MNDKIYKHGNHIIYSTPPDFIDLTGNLWLLIWLLNTKHYVLQVFGVSFHM